MRKYEIYLPLKYNDGKAIESERIVGVWDELANAFGGITVSPLSAPYQRRWKYGGVEYIDEIIKVEVVATNDRAAKKFLKELRAPQRIPSADRYSNYHSRHSGYLMPVRFTDMKLSIENLKQGMMWWQDGKWPKDYLNHEYYCIYQDRVEGLTEQWLNLTIERLVRWKDGSQ